MLKHIEKRDGRIEPFCPNKVNKWSLWASEDLGDRVDWSDIVTSAIAVLPETTSSQKLQLELVNQCLYKNLWPYNLMAGRLYAAYLHKHIYGDSFPTVKQLHVKLTELGYMVDMGYSDSEYEQVQEIIDHTLDFTFPQFSLKLMRDKYQIKNVSTGQEYETAQFMFMRMAMALSANYPEGDERIKSVKEFYKVFSSRQTNSPTPNYVNLGTKLKGYASCCIFTTEDTARSLATGAFIAETMTYMSAGIGGYLNCRSVGDPVRGGTFPHQGKLGYYRNLLGAIKANLQNGRGGAGNISYLAYDPEAETISKLKNPLSPVDKRIRGLDYTLLLNKFFARKAAKLEDVFTFTEYTAPDLHKAMFSGDEKLFAELYAKYEADPLFKKNYVSARNVLITMLNEAYETGRAYYFNTDEANQHTPFLDPIYSSNLCVAGHTKLMTKKGEFPIQDLEGQVVEIWNGQEWSLVNVEKTGTNQKLLEITFSGTCTTIQCTDYHKFYIVGFNQEEVEVRAHELRYGDVIYPFNDSDGNRQVMMVSGKRGLDGVHDTYCVNEPLRHRAMFNGVLTGQCLEISLPTKGYSHMSQLFDTSEHREGEIALCSLGGVVISNVEDDDDAYYKVVYKTLEMIDTCIDLSDYEIPHLGTTAKARRSAGVGIMDLAYYLAKKGLKYSSIEGKKEIARIAERHAYMCIKASLQLGKERGNAPWMNRTKWPDGWLPIDTYNKSVDEIIGNELHYDWESLRNEIIENKGIRNSALVSYMPGETSSKAAGACNAIYPIRDFDLMKSDNTTIIDWVAPDNDILRDEYELAWHIHYKDLIDCYAIVQKFTDQAISADFYRGIFGSETINATEMLDVFLYSMKRGLKSRYYVNTPTSSQFKNTAQKKVETIQSTESIIKHSEETNDIAIFEGHAECEGGFCKM